MEKSPETLAWVRRLFADPTKTIVFHNAKFDLEMFEAEGIDPFEIKAHVDCTLLLSKVYNGMLQSHELEWLGKMLLRRDTKDKTEIKDWLAARNRKKSFVKQFGRKLNFSDVPREIVKRRVLWDVKTTLLLWKFLIGKVQRQSPELYETERQLMFVVIDMELTGIAVDVTRAEELKAQCLEGMASCRRQLNELVGPFKFKFVQCKDCKRKSLSVLLNADTIPARCGRCGGAVVVEESKEVPEFNPGSKAIQVPWIFEQFGFQLKYKTAPKKGKKGGKPTGGGRWSFDEYSMMRYADPRIAAIIGKSGEESWPFDQFWNAVKDTIAEHDLPAREWLPPLILKMGELSKLVSTYYDHIIEQAEDVRLVDGRKIGRLHCKFNQAEAMTGRFSSSKPNMQNMPRILGPRQCFIPREDCYNYHVDYEQVEMKFFVHFARDETMADAFRRGEDMHLRVASELYHKPMSTITKEQRKRAKSTNFGIVYGSGAAKQAFTLTSSGLPTTVREATQFVNQYHRRFPAVRRTTNALKLELTRTGYVQNPFGRRYNIPASKGYVCLNYMCQGTSADLMKRAMVRIWKWLRANGLKSKILLQVHDELGLQIPHDERAIVVPRVVKMMQDLTGFFVPITVDVEVVRERWSHKSKVGPRSIVGRAMVEAGLPVAA